MGADKDEYEDKLEKMGAKGPEDGFEGPVRPFDNRGCTDILCCIFFILFWIGFVIVTITGFTTGNPELIGRGYDVSGKSTHFWLKGPLCWGAPVGEMNSF